MRFDVTAEEFYPQWNPYNADDTRGFAREYVAQPNRWQFNTFNRMSFWIKPTTNGSPLASGGRGNYEFGTYVNAFKMPIPIPTRPAGRTGITC